MTLIKSEVFEEIRKAIPIVCVDLVIPKDGEILLVKRMEPPAQGQWWTPGGRILKGETIEEASVRKAKEEVHLDCRFRKVLGVTESIFDEVIINGKSISIHTVNVVCLMEPEDPAQSIQLDNSHSEYRRTKGSFGELHPAVKRIFDLFNNTR